MLNSIYANARAKAKESGLLGLNRLNRMVDTANPNDAIKILAEVGFGYGMIIDDVSQFENLIFAEEEKLCAFIHECCSSEFVKKFLLIAKDFQNAEIFMREKHLKSSFTGVRLIGGLYDVDTMKECIMTDNYSRFDKIFADALIKVDEMFVSGNYNGMKINSVFERSKFSQMCYYLSKSKNKVLKDIFRVKVDLANISISLRARDYNLVKDDFIDGGTLSERDLKSLCEDSFASLKEKFAHYSQKILILSAIDSAEKGKPLSDFEQKADDYALQYLSKYKYSFDGIFPFLLYVYYKKAELNNVRIILVGLLNGVSAGEIKKRLRLSYAG